MQKKIKAWDVARTLEKLKELVEPGVIGFYRSVEVTEVLGVQGKVLTNFLTLAVAEPLEAPPEPDWNTVLLNGKVRHKLQPGRNIDVGIAQYRLPVKTFLERVAEFGANSQWKSGKTPIQTGSLAALPPLFVPADGIEHHPWNGFLKNNFFEGSHVLELFDSRKQHLRPLLEDSRRLSSLAEIVGKYLPIKIDGMSDRLGNIIIQLPVTVLSTEVHGSAQGDHSVAVAWHPDAPPRRARVSAEIWKDSTVTSFDSVAVTAGETKLELNSPGGGARTHIWDEDRRILLSATTPVTFLTSMSFSVTVDQSRGKPSKREFLLPESSGNLATRSLTLIDDRPRQVVGSPQHDPREPWVAQRIFSESVVSLKERKEFVQYGLDQYRVQDTAEPATKAIDAEDDDTESEDTSPEATSKRLAARMEALEDLHWLMKTHGNEGVWLWDPYLSADDVLRTLFFCPHNGVPLRALTAGHRPPGCEQRRKDEDAIDQRERKRLARERAKQHKREQGEQLDAAKGNCLGLQLEFRIREGSAGWAFHDRFIIFPRAQGSALAWSLGTSINSFGNEHHILQKVSHGEPIAQAFKDLWERLAGEKYLVWKTPANAGQEQ